MHPFLAQLQDIHARVLDACTKAVNPEPSGGAIREVLSRDLLPLLEKEERLVLAKAAAKADIQSGGPLCLLYFDLHLQRKPLDAAARAVNRKCLDIYRVPHAPHLHEMVKQQSPACIPLADHVALRQLSEAFEQDGRVTPGAAATFLMIVSSNFEKKDRCLFPMMERLLTAAELDRCQHEWNES